MANFKKHSGNYISTKSLGIDFSLYSHSDYIVKTKMTMFKVIFYKSALQWLTYSLKDLFYLMILVW